MRTLRAPGLALLLVALVSVALTRVARHRGSAGLTGDEGISLLAATCHQREYLDVLSEKRRPYGAWVDAREWKRLVRPEEAFCFGTIAKDLVATDLHPPLYFWVLHLWLLIVGLQSWSLLALNVLIAAGTAVGLFLLGKRLFGSDLAAGTLAIVWSASPQGALGGLEGRPYELLALCVVWLLERLVRCTEAERPPSNGQLASLAAWSAAGLLTHYMFLFALPAAALLGAARSAVLGVRRAGQVVGAVAAGLIAACLVHPVIQHMGKNLRPHAVAARLRVDVDRLNDLMQMFALPFEVGPKYPVLVSGGLLALGLAAVLRPGEQRFVSGRRERIVDAAALIAAAAAVLTAVDVYAGRRLPGHAVGPKYLTFIWPYFALGLVALARAYAPVERWCLLALLWISSLSLLHAARGVPARDGERDDPEPAIRRPLAYFTSSWHPTAATIARRDDDDDLFLGSPKGATAEHYQAWLAPTGRGVEVAVVIPSKHAEPLLHRLQGDGYSLDPPAPPIGRGTVRFIVKPRDP